MVHLESLIFILVLMYDALVKHQKSCHSRPRQGFLPALRLRQAGSRQAQTMKMVPVILIRKPGSQEFKLTL